MSLEYLAGQRTIPQTKNGAPCGAPFSFLPKQKMN
jgi:hypothetical protein